MTIENKSDEVWRVIRFAGTCMNVLYSGFGEKSRASAEEAFKSARGYLGDKGSVGLYKDLELIEAQNLG